MLKNPLIKPIFEILKNTPLELSEYELIRRLVEQDQIQKTDAIRDGLGLFKTHFLVMNALYQLQQQLFSEQRYLFISAQHILLTSSSEPASTHSLALSCDDKLRTYYLDLNNLIDTTENDVAQLLDGFWLRYHAMDQRVECLATLGLNAAATWQEIKQQYRRLVKMTHPDKGGNPEAFIEIRDAYQTLARIYRSQIHQLDKS